MAAKRSLSLRLAPITLVVALALAPAAGATGAEHLVLVSVDGLRPEFYLDVTWPAPMMQQLRAAGAHAEAVAGVFPSVTYPSHTTIVTGALPARHGIHYNSPFEPAGQTGRWYWHADAIRARTLWQAVRDAGGTSAALGWPVTVGAPIDRNVPEIWSIDPEAEPLAAMRAATRPAGLWAEIEREATGRLTAENFTIDHMTRDDRAGAAAAYLLETYRPTLLAVHLFETDHFQHEDGRESPRVRRAVAVADRAIAQIYEAAERAGILARTAFVITGDHGHVDRHTLLAPNVWLAEAGLRTATPDRGDWRATFHTSAASAFLILRDPADAEALARVRTILAARPAGVRAMFRILERDELDRLGAAPDAVLALAPRPGIDLTDAADGPALQPARGATHGYLPDFPHIMTGLIASGAGIRPGAVAAELRLVDVAPLVAHLLGLDLEAADGSAPLGFMRQEEE